MDQVAALAKVPKLTIYRHFADKSTLFAEVVTSTVDHASSVVQQEILALGRTGDLDADLHALTRRQLVRNWARSRQCQRSSATSMGSGPIPGSRDKQWWGCSARPGMPICG
jgi:AcrR family transcriptional regulator